MFFIISLVLVSDRKTRFSNSKKETVIRALLGEDPLCGPAFGSAVFSPT